MSNFTRKLLRFSVLLLAVGFGMMVAGGVMTRGAGTYERELTEEIPASTYDYGEVSGIVLNATAGVVNVLSSDDEFRVESRNMRTENFSCELRNGVLYISETSEYASAGSRSWRGISNTIRNILDLGQERRLGITETSHLTVFIPDGKRLDYLHVSQNVGRINLDNINADQLTIELDGGDVFVTEANCLSLDVDIALGNCRVSGLTADRVESSVDAGNLSLDGKITNTGKFKCQLGRIALQLDGRAGDYSIDAKTDLGSITIDGARVNSGSYRPLGTASDAPRLSLDCDLGEISLNFN